MNNTTKTIIKKCSEISISLDSKSHKDSFSQSMCKTIISDLAYARKIAESICDESVGLESALKKWSMKEVTRFSNEAINQLEKLMSNEIPEDQLNALDQMIVTFARINLISHLLHKQELLLK